MKDGPVRTLASLCYVFEMGCEFSTSLRICGVGHSWSALTLSETYSSRHLQKPVQLTTTGDVPQHRNHLSDFVDSMGSYVTATLSQPFHESVHAVELWWFSFADFYTDLLSN